MNALTQSTRLHSLARHALNAAISAITILLLSSLEHALNAASFWRATMMTNPIQWWRNKSQHKRNNWALAALALATLAGMTVEALGVWSLIGALPGFTLIYLEGER